MSRKIHQNRFENIQIKYFDGDHQSILFGYFQTDFDGFFLTTSDIIIII